MAILTTRFDTTTGKDLLNAGVLREIHDTTARDAKVFYTKMVNDLTTKEYDEKTQRYAGVDMPVSVAEGQNIPVTTPVLGTQKTYTQAMTATGFRMTFMMNKFNKIGLWKRLATDAGKVMKEGKDIDIHTMFNNMTSTALSIGTGYDSLAIANNTHTGLLAGSTADNYDNYLGSALSVSALESARYYFATLVDDKGNYAGATPDTLFFNPTLWPTVKELFGSDLRPHELSNTKNWASEWGIKPFENPRLTSATCWGILAKNDSNYDFNVFTSEEPTVVIEDAFDRTLDRTFLTHQLYTFGWGDPRLLYCGNV